VIVERHDQAAAGLSLVRQQDAGRCGFVVVEPGSNGYHPYEVLRAPGIVSGKGLSGLANRSGIALDSS